MKDFLKQHLPEAVYDKARDNYKDLITDYKRDIYSEFGEDFIAAVLLKFKKNGFYVDVGAFRPKELSVTYYFYKKLNWAGVVVEPNPRASVEFQKVRSRDTLMNMGVAQNSATMTYYEFKDPTLNSFSQDVFESNKSTFVGQKEISVLPLHEILEKSVPEGTSIDLMNIDVEGLDLEVLKSNNWDKYSPEVLVIEDHKFEPEEPLKSEIVQFLKERGYQLKANCLISLIFQKRV